MLFSFILFDALRHLTLFDIQVFVVEEECDGLIIEPVDGVDMFSENEHAAALLFDELFHGLPDPLRAVFPQFVPGPDQRFVDLRFAEDRDFGDALPRELIGFGEPLQQAGLDRGLRVSFQLIVTPGIKFAVR